MAGRTPRRSFFQTNAIQQSVLLFASLVGPLCSLSFCPFRPSSCLHPKLSQLDAPSGFEHLRSPVHQRVSADREHFSTLDAASVDEDDFVCWGCPEAITLVHEPFVDEHFHCLRLVRKGEDWFRARHHRHRVLLVPFCPVFWPQTPPCFRRTFLCGPQLRAVLEHARNRSSYLSFLAGCRSVVWPALPRVLLWILFRARQSHPPISFPGRSSRRRREVYRGM